VGFVSKTEALATVSVAIFLAGRSTTATPAATRAIRPAMMRLSIDSSHNLGYLIAADKRRDGDGKHCGAVAPVSQNAHASLALDQSTRRNSGYDRSDQPR